MATCSPSKGIPTCSAALRSRVMKKDRSGWLKQAAKNLAKPQKKLRKAIQGSTKKSKDYASLKQSKKGQWLHSEEKILGGVSFKVKFLGSCEVPFNPKDGVENQKNAILCCREIKGRATSEHAGVIAVSCSKMTVRSSEATDKSVILMRHSTGRVAFSTVDPECPTTFCYVALVKNTSMAICHVFTCKTAKLGYELTFTCAQAFDYNYKAYVANKSGDLDSSVFEPTIEPIAIRSQLKVSTPYNQSNPHTRQNEWINHEDRLNASVMNGSVAGYMEIQATGINSSFIEGECENMFTDADYDQVSAWDASGRKDYIEVEASGQAKEEPLYMDIQPP